jgi:hypothetical protein
MQDAYESLKKSNTVEFNMRLPSITLWAAVLNAAAASELTSALRDTTNAIRAADKSSNRLGNVLIWLNIILAGATVVAAIAAVAALKW